jgi:hypothetical protein
MPVDTVHLRSVMSLPRCVDRRHLCGSAGGRHRARSDKGECWSRNCRSPGLNQHERPIPPS